MFYSREMTRETSIKNIAHIGTRTLDPQIKSLMLYRLSYAGCTALLGFGETGENRSGLYFGLRLCHLKQALL